ncbi:MAG: hypothetical protein M3N16_07140 [Actinomycetota bacterium]|nr:hypothetical protein [Actinomycetota bacterium]
MRALLRWVALAAAILGAVPAAAVAGTVEVRPTEPGGVLAYTTAPGETADLRVSHEPGAYSFEDPANDIAIGAGADGCTRPGDSPRRLRCPDAGYGRLLVQTGDGHDRVAIDGPIPLLPPKLAMTSTGAGDDVVTGGPQPDLIGGGPGSDTIHGGGGDDGLSGNAIFGGNAAADGADVVRGGDGNDGLRGAAGDDELHGDAGEDALEGWAGADRLHGGAGNDALDWRSVYESDLVTYGDEGDDLLDAGPGNDVLGAGRGRDVASGGDGEDLLEGATYVILVELGDPGPPPPGRPPTLARTADQLPDQLDCDGGIDYAEVGVGDTTSADCERISQEVTCPSSAGGDCSGSVAVDATAAAARATGAARAPRRVVLGQRRFRVRRGATKRVFTTISRRGRRVVRRRGSLQARRVVRLRSGRRAFRPSAVRFTLKAR